MRTRRLARNMARGTAPIVLIAAESRLRRTRLIVSTSPTTNRAIGSAANIAMTSTINELTMTLARPVPSTLARVSVVLRQAVATKDRVRHAQIGQRAKQHRDDDQHADDAVLRRVQIPRIQRQQQKIEHLPNQAAGTVGQRIGE